MNNFHSRNVVYLRQNGFKSTVSCNVVYLRHNGFEATEFRNVHLFSIQVNQLYLFWTYVYVWEGYLSAGQKSYSKWEGNCPGDVVREGQVSGSELSEGICPFPGISALARPILMPPLFS